MADDAPLSEKTFTKAIEVVHTRISDVRGELVKVRESTHRAIQVVSESTHKNAEALARIEGYNKGQRDARITGAGHDPDDSLPPMPRRRRHRQGLIVVGSGGGAVLLWQMFEFFAAKFSGG